MSLLDGLNEKQRLAAECVEGPVLVLAGAGSGKTRALTHRIAYMVKERDIDPSSILAITFTNKAAKEMKERTKALIGADDVFISTFHSFGVRMLRKYISVLGMQSSFNIYDMDDQKKVVSQIVKRLNIDIQGTSGKIVGRISKLKERAIFPENMDIKSSYDRKLSEIYSLYQKELVLNNAIDFTDILLYTLKVLEDDSVLEEIQNRFKYIMVDEYQDTNNIQYNIVRKISSKSSNLFVVGDENQGIYSFRGADINNILNFEKDFPNSKIIHLEKNYRSTSNILEAANHVIKNNSTSLGKNLWTESGSGDLISIYETEDSKREARKIVGVIKDLASKDSNYSSFTILYRNNFQAREIEEELIRMCLPYKVYGGMQFYQRKEIKDMISYLSLANNPKDRISFQRVVNFPQRGLGQITVDKLLTLSTENSCSALDAINYTKDSDSFSSNIKRSLFNFKAMMESFSKQLEDLTISELLEYIFKKAGVEEFYKKSSEEDRLKNVKELINASKAYDGLSVKEYLERVALASSIDSMDENKDHIKLMTIHSSKGLEFDNVFLVGLEEEVFPNSNAVFEDKIQEERRLFYVAITRARKRLYITYSKSRMLYDAETRFRQKSRFIKELPEKVIDFKKPEDNSKKSSEALFRAIEEMKRKKAEAKKVIDSNNKLRMQKLKKIVGFSLGDRVSHKAFGKGSIVSMNLDKVVIDFDQSGEKKFLSATVSKFVSKA